MLHIIFYTVLIILILSFFGVSLESIVHSPEAQTNFAYAWSFVLIGWHYIQGFYDLFISWLGNFVH